MAELLQNAAFLTFLGGIVTTVGAWFAAKWKHKDTQVEKAPDLQTTLNKMVDGMREFYVQEQARLLARIIALEARIAHLEKENSELRATLASEGITVAEDDPTPPKGGA